MKSAIIIGGGIGGLFTGAFLAKNGIRVIVLEKNAIIGGGLQSFPRNGKIYETGMHIMGGFQEGGNLYKICRYLGIYDRLRLHHLNDGCIDEIRYVKTDETYRIPSGRENFIKRMSEYFPAEEEGIRRYVDAIYRITEELPLYYLEREPENIPAYSEEFLMPADSLISKYVKDERLRELLAYLNPLYSGKKGSSPAYQHALLNVLYISGASRFVGGSQQLADALSRVIEDNGGEVHSNSEVTKIGVKDKQCIEWVETNAGKRMTADWYISAIHPLQLAGLVPPDTFRKSFRQRLNELPSTYSAFSLYIDLHPGKFPYIDHTCYYYEDYGNMWNQDEYDSIKWPQAFMYMTPPDEDQGEYAGRLLVHCIMNFGEVRRWEDTKTGHRGEEYESWKKDRQEKVLGKLESLYPGIKGMIANVYASSPLSIRDFYNTKEGSLFGYRKDCNDMMISNITINTKIKNLLMTGQNINLHGMCGVPLTAIMTADAILGANTIINQIKECKER